MASRKFKESWIPSALPPLERERPPSAPPLPAPRTLFRRALVIYRFTLVWFFRELSRYIFAIKSRNTERSQQAAQETREFAERMGGMWVIIARLAALRGDLLGVNFCAEVAKTRDRAVPIPVALVQSLVAGELKRLGTSFEEVFASIDPVPLSARSFGQFHRACLKDGRQVVIRVRLPDAKERAAADWKWLRVIKFIIEQLDIEPHLRWDDLLFEVKKTTDDMLDFRTEVNELRLIRKLLRPRRVYVPEVFEKLCTESLLVTEYIQGVSVAQLRQLHQSSPEQAAQWQRTNKIFGARIWRRLFNVHHELLFEHNLFYTELLPSSILLLRGGRIALVSLNTITSVEADVQDSLRMLARALSDSDYTKACDTYLTLGPPLPYKDITEMRQLCLRALRKWESRTHVRNCPYREKSMAAAMEAMSRCMSSQELPTSWNIARLQLAERTLEPTLEFFGSTKNSLAALKRYDRAAQLRSIVRATTKGTKKRAQRALDVAQLNMQLIENLFYDGDYLRRRLQGFSGKVGHLSQVAGRMLLLVSKFAMIAVAVQVLAYLKQRFWSGTEAVPDKWGVSRLFGFLQIQSRATWILIIALLFYFRRFLTNLVKQLFSPEIGPSDV